MSDEQKLDLEGGTPELSSENKQADTGQLDQQRSSTPKIGLLRPKTANK